MLDSPGAGPLLAGFSPGPVWVRICFTGEGLPTWPPTSLLYVPSVATSGVP